MRGMVKTLSFLHQGLCAFRAEKKNSFCAVRRTLCLEQGRKDYNGFARRGQMKIMQMAFMVLAAFIFFIMVGLFFLQIELRDLTKGASELQREQAISSLEVLSNMPEFNCEAHENMCLDKDKLKVMSVEEDYGGFWPVASIKVYQVYPPFDEEIKCPAVNCNYYEIYDGGQRNVREYSTFISLCERVKELGYVYDECEIGKLVVGMKIYEE